MTYEVASIVLFHFSLIYKTSMEIALNRINQLERNSNEYKTLNAMLNYYNTSVDDLLIQTQQIVIQQINQSDNLQELACRYDNFFIKPFVSNGGSNGGSSNSESSKKSSPTSSPLASPINSPRMSRIYRKQSVRDRVRRREGNICALTGQSDLIDGTSETQGLEVAHIIPHSLLNKAIIHQFIKILVPWLPDDFFLTIDTCENAILLNKIAHMLFGNFKWFIIMEENGDPNLNVYKASQVEENGLLKAWSTGRIQLLENGAMLINSSYNQELFIGKNLDSRPTKFFIKLHELLARILYMRGGAEYYQDESDYEEEIDEIRLPGIQMDYIEKVQNYLNNSSQTLTEMNDTQ